MNWMEKVWPFLRPKDPRKVAVRLGYETGPDGDERIVQLPVPNPNDPHWEAVPDPDGLFWRVRWSQPDVEGRYEWVGHYATESCPAEVFAKSQAKRWNAESRHPSFAPDLYR